jgi:polyisoprenyl-phosphate glycosyltransferase
MDRNAKDRVDVTIVAPLFNEEQSIEEFLKLLRSVLDGMRVSYEVVLVDDGSTDSSLDLLQSLEWSQLRLISFVSNAGHQAALDAGYRSSVGDFVVTMDSDLQHPPEVIPELYKVALDSGVDVVYAVRPKRKEDGIFKRLTARAYYSVMGSLTDIDLQDSAADFRIVSRKVVTILNQLAPGRQVFRLLIPSLGFPSRAISYKASERFAGESKYGFRRMVGLSVDSVIQFSTKPLTLAIQMGVFVSILSLFGFAYVLLTYLSGNALQGWASLISTVLLLFGVLFVLFGIFGLYLATLVRQLQGRPPYIIKDL